MYSDSTATATISAYCSGMTPYDWERIDGKIFEAVREHVNARMGNKEVTAFIADIEMLVPNKVMKVYFNDESYIKVVCHDFDEFNIYAGCYIAIAKKLYGKDYTCEGIEHMARQLSYQKKYVYIVNKAVKEYEKKTMLAWKEAIASKREEAIAANKKRKREAYIKRRDERRRQARIDEMAEAFKKAMKE